MAEVKRTIAEINEKIKRGEAVVATAEEIIDIVEKDGLEKTFDKVDVVTTGTFAPMCSSGAFLKFWPFPAEDQTGWGRGLSQRRPPLYRDRRG